MKLHADISAEEYELRPIDPTDHWDIGDQGLTNISVSVSLCNTSYGFDVEPVGDTVCVLVEHYSDGCTFGSGEYTDLKGIFPTQEEAEAFAATLSKNHGYFGSHIDWLYFNETIPTV